jgi:hypothetical protein
MRKLITASARVLWALTSCKFIIPLHYSKKRGEGSAQESQTAMVDTAERMVQEISDYRVGICSSYLHALHSEPHRHGAHSCSSFMRTAALTVMAFAQPDLELHTINIHSIRDFLILQVCFPEGSTECRGRTLLVALTTSAFNSPCPSCQ